jgi:hypothetical protein
LSCYPNLFHSPEKGFTAYLLHVGTFRDDIVIYRLGPDGKPESFDAGAAPQVIGEPLRKAAPNHFIGRARDPEQPFCWGFRGCKSWEELAAVLNGPARVARTEARAAYDALCTVDAPTTSRPATGATWP